MKKLKKLFVCIGAQKAGTTWLYTVLSKDKRFSICPFVKEIHYLSLIHNNDNHLNNWRKKKLTRLCKGKDSIVKELDLAWKSGERSNLIKYCQGLKRPLRFIRNYSLLVAEPNDEWYIDLLRIKKQQLCALDITPDYATIGVDGFKHLLSLADDIKILYILRNPVERAWSGLLQGKKNTPEEAEDFILNYGRDIDFLFHQCTKRPDVKIRNDYLKTLCDIKNAGLNDNLMITFFEKISENPESLIRNIYNFIELEAPSMSIFNEVMNKKIYESKKILMPVELEVRLKENFRKMIMEINNSFTPVPNSWIEYFGLD